MAVIFETLHQAPNGTPLRKAQVTIELVVPIAYDDAANVSFVAGTRESDALGYWSADLPANADLTPEGTTYKVTVRHPSLGSPVRYIEVPQGGGSHHILDVLTEPPSITPGSGGALADHLNDPTAAHAATAISVAAISGVSGNNVQEMLADLKIQVDAGGGGAAVGGVLSGTLPNPGFAEDMATQAELDATKFRGFLSPIRDGYAVGDGSTDDTVGLQNWINACDSQNKVGLWDAVRANGSVATYKITAALDLRGKSGLTLIGFNDRFARLEQHTLTEPALILGFSTTDGRSRFNINGLRISYPSLASAGGDGIRIQNAWMSNLENIEIINAHTGIKQVDGSFCFSVGFRNIRIKPYANRGMDMRSSVASTGCHFSNIYISNGNNVSKGTASHGMQFKQWSQNKLDQINIEWCTLSGAAIELETAREFAFDSVNLEGLTFTGNDKGAFLLGWGSSMTGDGITYYGNDTRSSDGVTRFGVFNVNSTCNANVGVMRLENNNATGAVLSLVHGRDNAAVSNSSVQVQNLALGTGHSLGALDTTTISGGIRHQPVLTLDGAKSNHGGYHTLGDANATLYSYQQAKDFEITGTLTADRTFTLSDRIADPALSATVGAIKTLKGAEIIVYRSAGGTGEAILVNHNGTEITRLPTADTGVRFVFDGTNYRSMGRWGAIAGGGGNITGHGVDDIWVQEADPGTGTDGDLWVW